MEMNLNDKHLRSLLANILEKLADTGDPQFGRSVASVASFATSLITSLIISVADNRADALQGVHDALADCKTIINKSYDVLDALNAAHEGKVH
jgi:hypothetical protein